MAMRGSIQPEWRKRETERKQKMKGGRKGSWSAASWKVFLERCLFVGLRNQHGVYNDQPCHHTLLPSVKVSHSVTVPQPL